MNTKDYIQTTYKTLETEHDVTHTLNALKKYLKRRGHSKLLPSILKGLHTELSHHAHLSTVRVILARKKDYEIFRNEIEGLLLQDGKVKPYEVVVNESIIGGYIIKSKTRKIDRSYKSTLLQTYCSLKK